LYRSPISVVIPTFNRPGLLSEALRSLTLQDISDFEVVVVNDAGCDVQEIVDSFSAILNIKYVNKLTNAGLAAARNSGIEASYGEYIAYLDDDDIFLPEHLRTLKNALDEWKEVGLVYSDAILQKELEVDGVVVGTRERPLKRDYDRNIMLHDSFICPSAVMNRRECIERVGGFDEEMRWCYEDWDFFLKVNTVFEIRRVAGATVKIRLRDDGSNMSSKVNRHRIDAARKLRERYGVSEIEPKTFWEVAETLEALARKS
jgi:glycosyltransferase involved in cell wall biosynthesis